MIFRYYFHALLRDLTNFSFLRHCKYAGFLISMHQSGTHWLKHMLAISIARHYNLPLPQYNHANDIIGGPKDPIVYPQTPRLGASHTIVHPLAGSSLLRRLIRMPKYIILVRDMRSVLSSNYIKWKGLYDCGFSEYLHDFSGKKFHNQIWWCIRFMNIWGKIAVKFPEDTLVVKYEELCADTLQELGRINDFLKMGLGRDLLLSGISASSKDKMQDKSEPGRPEGGGVVRAGNTWNDLFTAEDGEFLRMICGRLLKYDFGYEY